MTVRVFLTGATGYIGGEVLYQISQLPEKYQIRCLVRGDEKAAVVQKQFTEVVIVRGDLDDVQLIEQEARDADVVFHLASTRHEASSRAIASGLSNEGRKSPAYWIQMSGASMFSTPEIEANRYGESSSKVYDEATDIDEIRDVIKLNPARVVDNLVLAQDVSRLKAALIVGPMIYGVGRGPVNTTSIQGPCIVQYALTTGQSFMVGEGESVWSNIHVQDLGDLMVLLLKSAVEQREDFWKQHNIVLPENGSMNFGEIARQIAKSTQKLGLTKSDEVESVTVEKANSIMPHGAVLLGTNARLKSSMVRSDLGWAPKKTLEENIDEMVTIEAQKKRK